MVKSFVRTTWRTLPEEGELQLRAGDIFAAHSQIRNKKRDEVKKGLPHFAKRLGSQK